MATEQMHIHISQSGAKQTRRAISGLSVAMAGAGYAALRMGKAFVESADRVTNLRNQTKVFSKDQGDANYRFQETVRISREMNQSLGAVGQVMQRLSLAQDSVGLSTEQVVLMTENLVKSVALSGATAQEAEGALRQFAQGLAANRFSGQELNSVLEQTPLVAAQLAESLGVAVGDLRAMGEAGELTAKVLTDAFAKEMPKLEEMFQKYVFPMEALFTGIKTEVDLFLDKIGETTGVSTKFKSALQDIKIFLMGMNEQLEKGGPLLDKITMAVDGLKIAGIGFLAIGLGAAIAALVTSVVGLAAIAATAVGAVYAFRNEMFKLGGRIVSLNGILEALWNNLKMTGNWLLEVADKAMAGFTNKLEQLLGVLDDAIVGFGILHQVATDPFGDWSINTLVAQNRTLNGSLEETKNILADIGTTAFEANFGKLLDDASVNTLTNYFKATGASSKDGREVIKAQGAPASGAGNIDKLSSAQADDFQDLQEDLMPWLEAQREYKENQELINAATKAGNIDLSEQQVLTALLTEEYQKQMDTLNFDKLQDTQAMWGGAQKGFQDFFEGLGSEADAWAQGIEGSFNMASSALSEFASTGRIDMKKFATDMIAQVQKMIIKLLLLKALKSAAGMAAGSSNSFISGLGSSALQGLSGRATGGPVTTGQPYMVGEKGPELFVPPSGGSIKNATQTSGMMQPQVNVSVVNVDDPNSVPQAMSSDEGEEVVMNIISRNSDVLRELSTS